MKETLPSMKERRLQTFDFYDTLVTRLVGCPADIFSLVGERLNIPDFRHLRLSAEERARRIYGKEVTFDQIYNCLPLPQNIRCEAYKLEIELENDLIVPVRSVASRLHTGDIVITDMYHRQDFFRDILFRLIPGRIPERIYVSGSCGASKADGLLWQKVAFDFPSHRFHIGDNYHADVKQASRHGFQAIHYSGAHLNAYEKELAEDSVDGSLLAGASRAARANLVDSLSDEMEVALITTFTSVIAPVLYAFSEWVIEECVNRGIRRAFFLARDGYLPFRICKILCETRGVALDCQYIYGSRQALHLPGFKDISLAEDWLLEKTHDLSLRTIANRAGIALCIVQEAAAKYMTADPDRILSLADMQGLRLAIRDPSVVEALRRSSNAAFKSAIGYYRSVGLSQSDSAALVDIGWNGRMQQSLRSLLDKSGEGPELIAGLYLCMSRRNQSDNRNTYQGFLFERTIRRDVAPIYDRYRAVLEAALTADHPTTIGFSMDGDEAHPIFGREINESMQKRIRLQHAVVEEFVANVIKLERAGNRRLHIPLRAITKNLDRFLQSPSRQDGLAFCGFAFADGQMEGNQEPICKISRLQDILYSSAALGWWSEGTLSASRHEGLGYLLRYLYKIKRCLYLLAQVVRHFASPGGRNI